MAPPSSPQRKVLLFSGTNQPGLTHAFCQLAAAHGVRLLHLGQRLVHSCLSIHAEVEIADAKLGSFIAEAENWAQKSALSLIATDLPARSPTPQPCGIVTTVLGQDHTTSALPSILSCLEKAGLAPERIETISDEELVGVHLLASKETITNDELRSVRRALLQMCEDLQVDIAVQRDDAYRTNKRLLCMDVDSTFVKGEFIDELADMCGVKSEVAEITAQAMRGELDFEQALRKRVKLLKGLSMTRARELCDRFELTPGADDLVMTAKHLGMKVGLVSGGFDFFVERLKKQFDLDFAFANELEVQDGLLTGEVIGTVVDSHRKAQVLKDMAHVFGVRLEQTIAAGDGANDIQMLQTAGLGIAYQAKPRLVEVAATRFSRSDRLDTLFYLMGFDPKKLRGDCT